MPLVTSMLLSVQIGTASSGPAPTPTPTPVPPVLPAISSSLSSTVLVVLIVIALALVGLFVLLNNRQASIRKGKGKGNAVNLPLPSVIRAGIAIALVVALIVYTGATLGGQDESVRSALVGGLVAAVASATAYYFASNAAQQALNAVSATTATANAAVPDLRKMTLTEALSTLGSTNFKLVIDASSASTAATPPMIASQDHAGGSMLPGNSEIVVKLAPASAAATNPATAVTPANPSDSDTLPGSVPPSPAVPDAPIPSDPAPPTDS
jgi:hypothetical protein